LGSVIHGAVVAIAKLCRYATIPTGKNRTKNHLSSLPKQPELSNYAAVPKRQLRLIAINNNARV